MQVTCHNFQQYLYKLARSVLVGDPE